MTPPSPESRPIPKRELHEEDFKLLRRLDQILGGMLAEVGEQPRGGACAEEEPWARLEPQRSARVVLIDGKRGTGKTTLLLTALQGWLKRGEGEWGWEGQEPKVARQLRVLPVLDFDPMPPNLPLLAWIIGALEPLARRWRERPRDCGSWQEAPSARSKDRGQPCLEDRWKRLFDDALLAWSGGAGAANLQYKEPERLQLRAWRELFARWRRFIDDLLQAGEGRGEAEGMPPGGMLVLPIDDVDMQVERVQELVLALRNLHHPRLVFVVTGNLALIQEVLQFGFDGEAERLGRPLGEQGARAGQPWTREGEGAELGRLVAGKVFRVAERIETRKLDLRGALGWFQKRAGSRERSAFGEAVHKEWLVVDRSDFELSFRELEDAEAALRAPVGEREDLQPLRLRALEWQGIGETGISRATKFSLDLDGTGASPLQLLALALVREEQEGSPATFLSPPMLSGRLGQGERRPWPPRRAEAVDLSALQEEREYWEKLAKAPLDEVRLLAAWLADPPPPMPLVLSLLDARYGLSAAAREGLLLRVLGQRQEELVPSLWQPLVLDLAAAPERASEAGLWVQMYGEHWPRCCAIEPLGRLLLHELGGEGAWMRVYLAPLPNAARARARLALGHDFAPFLEGLSCGTAVGSLLWREGWRFLREHWPRWEQGRGQISDAAWVVEIWRAIWGAAGGGPARSWLDLDPGSGRLRVQLPADLRLSAALSAEGQLRWGLDLPGGLSTLGASPETLAAAAAWLGLASALLPQLQPLWARSQPLPYAQLGEGPPLPLPPSLSWLQAEDLASFLSSPELRAAAPRQRALATLAATARALAQGEGWRPLERELKADPLSQEEDLLRLLKTHLHTAALWDWLEPLLIEKEVELSPLFSGPGLAELEGLRKEAANRRLAELALLLVGTHASGGRPVEIEPQELLRAYTGNARAQLKAPQQLIRVDWPAEPDAPLLWQRRREVMRGAVQELILRKQANPDRPAVVAALAPQPLLIALGWELGDGLGLQVLHKARDLPWGWQPARLGAQMPWTYRPPVSRRDHTPALLLNLSGRNRPDDLRPLLPSTTLDIYEIGLDDPSPSAIYCREQRDQFVQVARDLLSFISRTYPRQVLHIFPALPAALAIEFGRLYLRRGWPALQIWDRQGESWAGPYALEAGS